MDNCEVVLLLDDSEVVESILTGTPVQKLPFRSPPRSSPRSSPGPSSGSSQKKHNRILKKLFCSSEDKSADDGVSDENLTASFPENTWGSPLKSSPHKPMKSPGLVIPTPYVNRKDEDFADFSTPIGPSSESEDMEVAWQAVTHIFSPAHDNDDSVSAARKETPPEKNTSSAHEIDRKIMSNAEQDDDIAFLPDDIREHLIKQASVNDVHADNKENYNSSLKVETLKLTHDDIAFLPDDIREHLIKQASVNDVHADNKENYNSSLNVETLKLTHEVLTPKVPSGMISLAEVQTLMDAAVQEAQVKWKAHTEKELAEKHAATLEAIQQDAEKQLMEHGEQWNKEHEEELCQVKKEMETRLEQQRLEAEQDKRNAEAKWMEMAEEESTKFLDKIFVLVTKAAKNSGEHECQIKEMRAEQAAKMERLETELKERQGALEEEKASLIEAVQENKELAERITTLEASVVTLEADKKLAQKAHEEAIRLLREETESKLDLTRKQLTEASTNEMEELISKIRELEANSTKLQQKHEESLKAVSEAHMIELKKQQDEFQDSIEKERQAASSMQSVASAEKQELAARVETLESSLSKEREANEEGRKVHAEQIEMLGKEKGDLEKEFLELRDTLEAERKEWKMSIKSKQEELLANLETLEMSLSNEREAHEQSQKVHAEQIEMAQKEKGDLEKELLELKDTMEAERKEWKMSIESKQEEVLANLKSVEMSLFNEREAHEQSQKAHAEQIEMVQKEKGDLEKELLELKDTLEAERKEWRTSIESKQEDMQSSYERKIQEMEERLEKQSQDFTKEKSEIMVMQRDTSAKEKELSERLVSVEAQAQMDKEAYAKRLQQVRDQHATEIDEMLAQLDLVEAEHNQKCEAKQEAIKQKEAIIAALGAQLADAAARTIALEAERQHDLARVEAARAEAENARTASKSLQISLDQLRDDRKRELEKERRVREEACQQVKKEMIAAAEEQFGKANELYVKLKHEYDSTMMKAGRIERELKSCKRELDSCRQEQAAREVEMRAELAQLKAALATGEADSAKKANAYILEVEAMRTVHRDLQEKLEAATSECQSARDRLALVTAEKTRLLKDNEEMKSVCEELMAMVEGGQ